MVKTLNGRCTMMCDSVIYDLQIAPALFGGGGGYLERSPKRSEGLLFVMKR